MHILALESSGLAGSVAAFDNEALLCEFELDPSRRTAQTLAPAIDAILRRVGWDPHEVQLVVVTQGPGSFTGLRIGVTTAKTFAYAAGAQVLGVNTLAAIARQSSPSSSNFLRVVMNAERNQLFAAAYQWVEPRWSEVEPTRIVEQEAWLKSVNSGTQVSGPGLVGLVDQLPKDVQVASERDWTPRAASVGLEGLSNFNAGQRSDCWSLLPNYFRESAATEKARSHAGP